MKYRSRTEIIDSMLRGIGSGATKTHIMYRAFMSYTQLKEYLVLLEERKLIEFDAQTQLFTMTEKGLRFLNVYEAIQELIPSAEERNQLKKQEILKTPAEY